jgi:manganese transport protein
MNSFFEFFKKENKKPVSGAVMLLKYIGPGLLVTIGFTDPGNWASNFAAGSTFGYSLLWMVTLSTLMLILLQHNVAHLGIKTGLCLAEATTTYYKPWAGRGILFTAMAASISTSLAEILGGAIALSMLFKIPLPIGAILVALFSSIMLFTNTYSKMERWIIGFLAIIALSFLYELFLVEVEWGTAVRSWVVPSIPKGSMIIVMSVLGAVVMPHNLYLHSEIIQSRQWNCEDQTTIKRQLKYEFLDTIFSMIVGWAINSAMIILAAAVFFRHNLKVEELQQAKSLLAPLLGANAAVIFAIALLFSGVASTITSGIAAGTIMAGIFNEPYNIHDKHSKLGVLVSYIAAVMLIFIIKDPFKGLIISQMILSMQLPIAIFSQIRLTSSKKVMGEMANKPFTNMLLYAIAVVVSGLNVALVISFWN